MEKVMTLGIGDELIQEQCPGPPPGTPPGTPSRRHHQLPRTINMDDKLGKELVQKEEELQCLRSELQNYVMKIRGYQTLEHLYQQSKQECTTYKQQNDDLERKLNSLMTKLSPVQRKDDESGRDPTITAEHGRTNTSTTAGVHKHGGSTLSADAVGETDVNRFGISEDGLASLELERFVGNAENRAAVEGGGETRGGGAAAGGSTTSSPSFVRINSGSGLITDMSPTSLASNGGGGGFDDGIGQQHQLLYGSDDALAGDAGARNISLEIEQITELLRHGTVGGTAGAENSGRGFDLVQDVSSNLIRTGVSVRKLETQNRVQKEVIERLTATVDALTEKNTAKQRTIDELQQRCGQLQSDVQQLQLARDQAMREARTRYIDDTAAELSVGGPVSAEWVEVEKRSTAAGDSTSGVSGGKENEDVHVTTVSTVEMELRKRIEKLNGSICELVTVNRNWDEHCRKLESDHVQQVAAINDELRDVRRRLDEAQRGDERQQAEFDQMLLNSKKQREIEEMAKEEALNQLHFEKRHRSELEERCSQLTSKILELESRIRDFQLSKQSGIMSSSLSHSGQVVLAPPAATARDRDLELQILREQVTVFKEDFDQERRDREMARAATEQLQTQLSSITQQLDETRKKLFNTLDELKQSQNENTDWRRRFQKVSDEVKALQSQARPVRSVAAAVNRPSSYGGNGYVTSPTPIHRYQSPTAGHGSPSRSAAAERLPSYHHNSGRMVTFAGVSSKWSCQTCTFLNDEHVPACTMCGLIRADAQLQPRGVGGGAAINGVTNGVYGGSRQVAGLPIYLPTGSRSAPPSFWQVLPNGSLETDQSRPSSSY